MTLTVERTLLEATERTPLGTAERTPLGTAERTPSGNYLRSAIFERGSPHDSHYCLRNTARIISLAASIISGVAFVPVSMSLPAGPAFASANFIGFLKLYMWAILNTIEDLWGPKEEKGAILLERARPGKCVTIAAISASVALAIFSQVPTALPALDYDGKLKVPAFISLLVGGSLLSLRSLQLSLQKMAQEPEPLRATLASMIDVCLDRFSNMDRTEQTAYINRLNELLESDFLTEIAQTPSESQKKCVPFAIGVWLALSFQVATAIYTFEKTKAHVIDNNVAGAAMAAATVASSAYLSSKSIVDSTQSFCDLFCQGKKSIAEQLHPNFTRALKILGGVIDLGALGATVVIWNDFYKDNTPAKIYFEITVCLAFFLFLSCSTFALVHALAEKVGNEEERLIIDFTKKLETTKKLISSASSEDWEVFFEGLPDEMRRKIQACHMLT